MNNKLKKFLEDSVKTHLEKAYEEKQMDVNGVYSPIEFILSETEQEKVNVKFQEINDLFNSSAKANEYEAKAKAFDEVLKAYDEAFAREHMAAEVSNIIEKFESGDYDI